VSQTIPQRSDFINKESIALYDKAITTYKTKGAISIYIENQYLEDVNKAKQALADKLKLATTNDIKDSR
jgi:hypothetical protein